MKNLLLLFLAMLGSFYGIATHITGGEISYTHIGNNDYNIDVTIYRDCGPDNVNGTQFDLFINLTVYEGQNFHSLLTLTSDVLFDIPSDTQGSDNPCLVVPSSLCVEARVFSNDSFGQPLTVNLPPSEIGYSIVYQRCCRNNSIINIATPDETGMTLTAEIPGTNTLAEGFNSSATFNSLPPMAFCLGQELNFNHSATDVDGDELVYGFCAPLLGADPDEAAPQVASPPPYTPVTWLGDYTAMYPLDADPQLTIDPATGVITGTPNMLERYTIGICVKEYRNGILIATVTREFQYQITICDPVISSAIAPQSSLSTCSGLTFTFENNSIGSTYYEWNFGDNSTLDDVSAEFEPTYTYSNEGVFDVTLIVNPGYSCADTAQTVYTATVPDFEVDDLVYSVECTGNSNVLTFDAGGSYSDNAVFSWETDAGALVLLPSGESTLLIDPSIGSYDVTFSAIEDNCVGSSSVTIDIPETTPNLFYPQLVFCDGLSYDFTSFQVENDSLLWDFGTSITATDQSIELNPSYTFPELGEYAVSLTIYNGDFCPVTQINSFVFEEAFNVGFDVPMSQCLNENSFSFSPDSDFSLDAFYTWEFSGPNSTAFAFDYAVEDVSWFAPGVYNVTLTTNSGTCQSTQVSQIEVIEGTDLSIEVFELDGCTPLLFSATANYDEDGLEVEWLLDGESIGISDSISGQLDDAGDYLLEATFTGETECPSEVLNNSASFTVWPNPIAGFETDPEALNDLNSIVSVTSTSAAENSCNYDIGGEFYFDCEFDYSSDFSEDFLITQTVTNTFGCTDTLSQWVNWQNPEIEAPNVFTPDFDGSSTGIFSGGLNEGWFLIGISGLENVHVQIFNRWGGLVYEDLSYSNSKPFKGFNMANELLSVGTYFYIVQPQNQECLHGSLTILRKK